MIKWPWKTSESTSTSSLPWDDAFTLPVLAGFSASEQQKLIRLAERFLQQKRLVPLQGFELDELKTARIALLFCLPVLELGVEWLDGFHEVLIYPAPFVVDDEWEDDIGLVHNQRSVQSGQSWQQGPVVLNWLDIHDSFDVSGFNLIVHEVAHKLDMRNGDRANGVPFIALRDVAGWEHDLHAAMSNIQDEIDLVGENATSIDAYAATDPAECFAVLSEYFFSAPLLFAPRFPSLWQRFCQFYRQDPLKRLYPGESGADAVGFQLH
ncbi:DgsA anti-repressor MtfA [Atlantibacter hermannii]|uniref:DgsA anti-repressor MtfA n=1 Tax=Atlantibacter hermannii TaxID=565 RepID=UPI0005C19DDA|nr:DgsA anti-repressor MtfA [Atlantibacter hermannii]KIU35164.1 DgsA anti-repressor MtfA [Atlantibacter hermannii]MCQ4968314.1 DgsA anti-repressor MtfA [Enterobacteriaceae bacterium DFI.7.85]MDU7392243.1 DgsA anti-repressor MtfA [Atlantibacter hermannii]MDW4577782.1 DgsA anti-repressor MtfA [Atlantibacter hermannii]